MYVLQTSYYFKPASTKASKSVIPVHPRKLNVQDANCHPYIITPVLIETDKLGAIFSVQLQ